MTIEQITKKVGKRRRISSRQVYRYLRKLKIQPKRFRPFPVLYPDNTDKRITIELDRKARGTK